MSSHPKYNGSSIKVTNFMCFGEERQGFDEILPINLIIGRNNTGKTALIEMLGYLIYSPNKQVAVPDYLFHGTSAPEFHIDTPINMQTITQAYPTNIFIGGMQGDALFGQAKRFIGQRATLILDANSGKRKLSFLVLCPYRRTRT